MSDRGAMVARALRDSVPSGDGWVRAACPFCPGKRGTPDRGRAWGMSLRSRFWHCFRCGARGRARDLGGHVVPDEAEPAERALERPSSYVPLGEGPGRTAVATAGARAYLAGRRVNVDVVRSARVGAAISGSHAGRIIVPVLDDEGRDWVGWIGRAWANGAELPYLYPRGMERGRFLYNHEALLREVAEPVIVVEGAFDAFPFWPDAAAVMGKPSQLHVEALVAARRPVAVVLDGDAWSEGWALSRILRMRGQRAGFVRLPPRTDPDEVGAAWLREEARRCLEE